MSLRTRPFDSPSLYAWHLHDEMLDALFDETSRSRLARAAHRVRPVRDHLRYTRELERWMQAHPLDALEVALTTGRCERNSLVWCELPFTWSEVALERQAYAAGARDVRCSFQAPLVLGAGRRLRVHGTFSPRHITCSTSGSELRGTRTQYVLGQVAELGCDEVELRVLAIVTRLVTPDEWPTEETRSFPAWQRIAPHEVDQFADADFSKRDDEALEAMSKIRERDVKARIAEVLNEPVVPKDWGGEQDDLWTTNLRVDGRAHTAAFLLKGPAGGSYAKPMTIAMLGKNGDQIDRLARTAAEVLVVQHCHQVGQEVLSMLKAYASEHANIRRYMVLDGYDTYAILAANDLL